MLLVSSLGACALTVSPILAAKDVATSDGKQQPQPGPGFTPQVLYKLLVAELAAQRGDFDLGVRQYKEAAYETRDPKVIERALRFAAFMQSKSDISELARLWSSVAPQASEPHQALAMLLLERGDVNGAAEQLEKVFSVEPKFGYMPLVGLLSRAPDKQVAMECMAQFMKSRQKDPDALFAQAHLATRLGELTLAETTLERALQLRPEWGDALVLQAHILQRTGKTAMAVERLQSALAGPLAGDFDLRLAYGRLLVDAQQFPQALAQFELLEKKNPKHPDVLYALGITSAQLDKFTEAERYFKRLLEMGEREAEASFQLGQVMEAQKREEDAIQWYGAVKDGSLMTSAQIRIVALLTNQRKYDQALAQLEAIEVDNLNDRLSVVLLHGEVMFRAKRYQEALAIYDEALGNFQDDVRLLYAHSLAAEKLDKLDLAEKDLRAILAKDPENAMALNALGYTLADRTQRYAEAKDLLQRALTIKPDEPAILDSMGWLQFRMGNLQAAVDHLQKALEKLNDPEISAHLGEVLWIKGERDRATKVWREGLKLDPFHEVLLNTMKRFGQ